MLDALSTPKQGLAASQAPVRKILQQCRNAFWFAFGLTFVIDMLSVTPLLYMMSAYDRVLSSRSGVTLVSLTLVVIAFYVFWSALEWIRARLMVRLSLRIDWDLAADVFDASFRRYVGRKNVNVHQLLGDLLSLRQFFTGQPALALMDAPFALIFIFIGAIFHPYLAIFAAAASLLMVVVDAIFSLITLQHNPPPVIAWMLRTLLSCLRSGGAAYIQLPTYRHGYLFEVQRYLHSAPTRGLEMHFLPQPDVFAIVEQANCRCLEIREDAMVGDEDKMLSNSFLIQKK